MKKLFLYVNLTISILFFLSSCNNNECPCQNPAGNNSSCECQNCQGCQNCTCPDGNSEGCSCEKCPDNNDQHTDKTPGSNTDQPDDGNSESESDQNSDLKPADPLAEIDLEAPGRLLSQNRVKKYHIESNQEQFGKLITLIDFADEAYASDQTKEYAKIGTYSHKWHYDRSYLVFNIPHDISAYNTITFWVYVPQEAVDESFYIEFKSDNPNSTQTDYFGKLVKFDKAGWMQVSYAFKDFAKGYSPSGWDNIDNLFFTNIGWAQNNNTATTIYIDNIQLAYIPANIDNTNYKLVNFSDSSYADMASTEQLKTGKKSLKWSYTTAGLTFNLPVSDITGYKALGFWVYVPEKSVGQTFFLRFNSENDDTDGIDYYGYQVNLSHAGWQQFTIPFNKISATRSPIGWHHIDNIMLAATGWNQTNNSSTIIYLDDFYLYKEFGGTPVTNIPLMNGALFSKNGARSIVDDILVNNTFDDNEARVFIQDGKYWLPLSVFGARYDQNSTYNEETKVLKMALNGQNYTFIGGQNIALVNQERTNLGFTVTEKENTLFAPVDFIESLMGYTLQYQDEMGMIYLAAPTADTVDFGSMEDIVNTMNETLFMRLDSINIKKRMDRHLGGDVHPRVLINQQRFDELKELIQYDPIAMNYFQRILNSYGPNSTEYKSEPVTYVLTDGVRLAAMTQKAANRIINMALLYRLTGRAFYVNRVWKEAEALINFPDWHPVHYLDTAAALIGMAVAYDWLYYDWTPEQLKAIEDAIYRYGFLTGLDRYEGRVAIWGDNNWAAVCNAGLFNAAVALANVSDQKIALAAQKILAYAPENIEKSLIEYAPDGGYTESPSYWSYGTSHAVIFYATMQNVLGTTLGLFYAPGFIESAYFTTYFESEAGSIGFHDSETSFNDTSCLPWFAKMTNDTSLGHLRYKSIEDKLKYPNHYDFMWYSPELIGENATNPLDAYYEQVGFMTMRDSWEKGAILTGLHAGYNKVPHGDLDNGNFVIYAGKYRYITELGKDNYNLPDYFGTARNHYYRKRAEGQNTLVIGNTINYTVDDQVYTATGTFLRHESSDEEALAIIDMTSAYEKAASAIRGLLFTDTRSTIVVQDELRLKTADTVRWAAHTEGQIALSSDGRSAIITMAGDNNRLYAEIVSADNSLKFSAGPANSYDPNYPASFDAQEKEISREKYSKLMIITPRAVSDFKVAVVFKYLKADEDNPGLGRSYTWKEMQEW